MSAETKPAASAEAPKTDPQSITRDPLMEGLLKDLGVLAEEKPATQPVPEIKPVAEPAPEPAKEPAAQPKTETPPAEQPKFARRDRRREAAEVAAEVVQQMQSKLTPPPLPPTRQQQPEPEVSQDDSWLSDDQREEVELARWAEASDPGKYKGKSAEVLSRFKEIHEYREKHKSDEDRTLDENDDEFVRFIRDRKPQWGSGELRRLQNQKLISEAKEAARKELQPELESARREAREAKLLPAIESKVSSVMSEISKEATGDDPLEKAIFEDHRRRAGEVAAEYLRVVNGVSQFNPTNQMHNWVASFIIRKADEFDKTGGASRVRDGKTFVPPHKYQEMINAGRSVDGVWTYGPDDVLPLLTKHAVTEAKNAVKIEEERATKLGFVRAARANSPKTTIAEPEPKPSSGLVATTSAAPGAAVQANDGKDVNHPGLEIMSVLGLSDLK